MLVTKLSKLNEDMNILYKSISTTRRSSSVAKNSLLKLKAERIELIENTLQSCRDILKKHSSFITCSLEFNRNNNCIRCMFKDFYADCVYISNLYSDSPSNDFCLEWQFYNLDDESIILSDEALNSISEDLTYIEKYVA